MIIMGTEATVIIDWALWGIGLQIEFRFPGEFIMLLGPIQIEIAW